MDEKIQELYKYVIGAIEVATEKERIQKAAGSNGEWHIGEKIAYSDVARRLVNMGCRLKNINEEERNKNAK